MGAGVRKRKIVVQRPTIADNDFGEPVPTWAQYAAPFAEVLFGGGQERRDAAQETGNLAATFRVLQTATTEAITTSDRIVFDGANWDIQSNVPSRAMNRRREITAVRAA